MELASILHLLKKLAGREQLIISKEWNLPLFAVLPTRYFDLFSRYSKLWGTGLRSSEPGDINYICLLFFLILSSSSSTLNSIKFWSRDTSLKMGRVEGTYKSLVLINSDIPLSRSLRLPHPDNGNISYFFLVIFFWGIISQSNCSLWCLVTPYQPWPSP